MTLARRLYPFRLKMRRAAEAIDNRPALGAAIAWLLFAVFAVMIAPIPLRYFGLI